MFKKRRTDEFSPQLHYSLTWNIHFLCLSLLICKVEMRTSGLKMQHANRVQVLKKCCCSLKRIKRLRKGRDLR